MTELVGLLPFAALLAVWLGLATTEPARSLRRTYLHAMVLWGTYAVALTEALSLARMVTVPGLLVGWSVPILWLGVRWRRNGPPRLCPSLSCDRTFRLPRAIVVAIVAITGLVAWYASPNTWDSLNYHMSRVAHWAQERAVTHFATGIEVQNNMPPGAEMLALNLYVLTGGDRLANFVQWFAMTGSLVALSVVAHRLGAGRLGGSIAMVYAATLPMGIVQASSTMTDYVAGLWVLAAASEALALRRGGAGRLSTSAYFGLATGLAVLAKPTAFAYLLPFCVLAAAGICRGPGLRRSLAALGLICLTVLGPNAGHFTRNIVTYGHPIGPASRIGLHANQLLTWRGLLSNVLRNASLHAGTPSPHVNKALALFVLSVHDLIDLDASDPRTTVAAGQFRLRGTTTQEDRAGNPLHAWLSLPVTALALTRRPSRSLRLYTGAVLLTFLLFCFLFKWQSFGSRLHLPFFLLLSPVVGSVIGRRGGPRVATVTLALLFLLSWPWLLGIDSRPLLDREGEGGTQTILTAERRRQYFANARFLEIPYIEMTAQIRSAQCGQIGLALPGAAAEYPLWVLLGAPAEHLRIEWMVAGTPSERYRDPEFRPCAVICLDCPEQVSYAGLPLAYQRSGFRVYIRATGP